MKKRISALSAALTVAVTGMMPAMLPHVQASVYNGNQGSIYAVRMDEEVENWCDVTGFSVTLRSVEENPYSFSGNIVVSAEDTISENHYNVYNNSYSQPSVDGDIVDYTLDGDYITLMLDHETPYFEDLKDVEGAAGKITIDSYSDTYVTDITYYYSDGSTSGGEISYRERTNMKVNLRDAEERWYAINGMVLTATLEDNWTDIGLYSYISFNGSNLSSSPYMSFSSYGGDKLNLYVGSGEASYEITDNVLTLTYMFDGPVFDESKYNNSAQASMQIKSSSGAYFTIDDITYLFDDTVEDPVYVRVSAYSITNDRVMFYHNSMDLADGGTYNDLMMKSGVSNYYSYNMADLPEDTVVYSGWFAEPEGGRILYYNTKLLSSEEHAIYSQSLPVAAHYIKFDAGEGDLIWNGSKNSYAGNTRVLAEDEVIMPDKGSFYGSMPTANWGTHKFLGWFTAPEGGEKLTNQTVIEGPTDITFYAQYDGDDTANARDFYLVRRYDMTGSTGKPVFQYDQQMQADSTYGQVIGYSGSYARASTSSEKFELGTAAAYDWYTEETGGHIIDQYSDEKLPGDTAIYLRREIYPCHYISFDAGDGEIFWSFSTNNYYEGNVPAAGNLQATVMEQHRVGGLPSAENGTHAFLGWFTEPEGGTEVTSRTIYTEKGDITLYAHWDDEDTTDAPRGIKVRMYSQNTTTGEYKVSRDYRGTDSSSYNALMFSSGSASGSASVSSSSSSSGIPDGMVYVYNYYDKAEGGDIVRLSDPLITEADHALYYRRELMPYYYVKFDANGGSLLWTRNLTGTTNSSSALTKSASLNKKDRTLADDEMIMIENQLYLNLPKAENGTKEFLGWFTAAEGGNQIDESTIFTDGKDITLYAHWGDEGQVEARDKVKISYYTLNSNTGEYELYVDELVSKDTIYSKMNTPALSTSTRITEDIPAGKTAVFGWYTEPDGGKRVQDYNETVKSADHALYYHYNIVSYHYVTFNPGNGTLSKYVESSGDDYPQTTTARVSSSSGSTTTTVKQPASNQILVTEDAPYGELPKAYWYGHEFLGWFTARQGGVQVTAETVYTATSDQTLYARWSDDDTPLPAYTLGDYNDDGIIDVTDAQTVLQVYADQLGTGTLDITEEQFMAADVDKDGEITVMDSQLILLYYAYNELAGIETTWEQLFELIK